MPLRWFFNMPPLPTSPVDGGGASTPSPPAGRVGVGAMFKSHCKDTYYGESKRYFLFIVRTEVFSDGFQHRLGVLVAERALKLS